MLHTKSQGHRPSGSGEDVFKGFYHIWAWRPSWSCDQDHLNKLLFPHPKESPYEIWVHLAQQFQRRRCLKMLMDGRRSHLYTISSPMSLRLRWAIKRDAPVPPSPTPGAWPRGQNKNPVWYVSFLLFVRTHTKFRIKIFENDCYWGLMIFDLLTSPQGAGPKFILLFHVTHTPNLVGFRPMVKEEIA